MMMAAGADDLRPRQLARIAQPVGHTLGARGARPRGSRGMSGRCSFARASGLEASGVLAQFLAPDALEIVRDALRSEEAWIRFLQPSSRVGEHAARLRVRALLFDPSLPRACDSSDAARVDPDGWGASLGPDVAGWARASVRLPHDDVYHTLEEDEEDWERARAAGALPSRRDRPDVSAPRAPPSHTAPRVRLDVDVLDDAARVRLSIAATEDAVPRGARDKNPLATAVARDDDDPTTRAWRDATARIRVARVDAARASVAEDERVPSPAASTRLAPAARPAPAGWRAFLVVGERGRGRRAREPVSGTRGSSIDGSAVSIDDGSNATRVPRRDATRGIRTVGDFDERSSRCDVRGLRVRRARAGRRGGAFAADEHPERLCSVGVA